MGVRSLVFTAVLITVCFNIFYFSASPSHKRNVRLRQNVKRNPSGGPINGYSVIGSVNPHSESELERRYDMVDCSQINGVIRDVDNKQLQIECGVIHSGQPIYVDTGKTFDDCLSSCAHNGQCVALAFEEISTRRCQLYDRLPPPHLTRGARHQHWLGAKVLNVNDGSQNEICTPKSLSRSEGDALGYVCATGLRYTPHPDRAVATIPTTSGTCSHLITNVQWDFFLYEPYFQNCQYFVGDIDTHECETDDSQRQTWDSGCFYSSCDAKPGPKPCSEVTYDEPEGEARGQLCDRFLTPQDYWISDARGSMTGSVEDCGRIPQSFEWHYFLYDGTKCLYYTYPFDKSGESWPWYGNQWKVFEKLCFKTCSGHT
ncbi:hypothetical protein B0J11DRAFT_506707 [Dendryphion nanum]|uniref:PAN-3 domain-containing protein n=1 Tax=Dendryphion nanum TaxID=256645 RepID=A0A9P9DQQ1_9PLEO|nr:hypothetical protein B0J11DRAFT_506707 [Dendryphion nanum]